MLPSRTARWASILFFINVVNCRTVDLEWCSVCFVRAEIQTGDVVRWTNLDQEPHSLISVSGDFEFTLKAKERVKRVFPKPGKFAYFCKEMPWMRSVVIVQESRPNLRAALPECVHKGKHYRSGSRIRMKCNKCSCSNGGWSCAVVPECKNGKTSIVNKTGAKGCQKCRRKYRISSRVLCRERFDYVIRCELISVNREKEKKAFLVVNVTDVFQSPHNHTLYRGLHKLYFNPVSLACSCPRLEHSNDYIVIGRHGIGHTIAIAPDSIVMGWSAHWRTKIRNYMRKVSRNKCPKVRRH